MLVAPLLAQARAASSVCGEGREALSVHGQATVVVQGHPGFPAPYSGQNSLDPHGNVDSNSFSAWLSLGFALWPGGSLHLGPELSESTIARTPYGLGGLPNGDLFRTEDPAHINGFGLAYLRQDFALGGGCVSVASRPGTLGGQRARSRLTLTLGRFAVSDLVDVLGPAHDPRTQFLGATFENAGAFDYAADELGLTFGLAAELATPRWSLRLVLTTVPASPGSTAPDDGGGSAVVESEIRFSVGPMPGAFRSLLFANRAPMGSYAAALRASPAAPDASADRNAERSKLGLATSIEQAVTRPVTAFARLSLNDGQNETWSDLEIDQAASLGVAVAGQPWARAGDTLGLAAAVHGLSTVHALYLARGGQGLRIGDGALQYAPEKVAESYYRLGVTASLSFTLDYQAIGDPAYNRDRGPVHFLGLRAHGEF